MLGLKSKRINKIICITLRKAIIFLTRNFFDAVMEESKSVQNMLHASDSMIKTSTQENHNNIKSVSSQWLVEDLTPATMIMVDDTLPGGKVF